MKLFLTALSGALAGGLASLFIYIIWFVPPSDVMARIAAFEGDKDYFHQNMSEVFPTRTVARGPVSISLPQKADMLDGFTFVHEDKVRTLSDMFTDMETAGLIILHRGQIIYEKYGRGAESGTRFTTWSLVKSITSTLVGLAIADGFIEHVDDRLITYLPDLAGTAYEEVTIRQALQMSSGIRYDPALWEGRMDDTYRVMADSVVTGKKTLYELARNFRRETEPGTDFNYNTAESQILIELVRRSTGMNAADYLSETLWQPLGMQHDAAWVLDRPGAKGAEIGGAMFNASLRDWARFGLFIEQGGNWQGRQLLPTDWVDRATVSDEAHLLPGQVHPNPRRGYAWHWWTYDNGNFTASGAHGQSLYIDRDNDLVVARASAWPEGYVRAHDDQTVALYEALAEWVQLRTSAPGQEEAG